MNSLEISAIFSDFCRRRITCVQLALTFLCFLTAGVAQEPQETRASIQTQRIEMLGTILSEGQEAHTGDVWWAFCRSENGNFELLQTTITVKAESDSCIGEYHRISIERDKCPWFLIRGPIRFTEGPVTTVSGFKRLSLFPGERYSIKRSMGGYDELFALGCVEDLGYRVKNYSINIRDGNAPKKPFQEILHAPDTSTEEPFPEIMWIGDLDRDGRNDLLVDACPYPGGRQILFLSSLAREGEIVRKAGEILLPSC